MALIVLLLLQKATTDFTCRPGLVLSRTFCSRATTAMVRSSMEAAAATTGPLLPTVIAITPGICTSIRRACIPPITSLVGTGSRSAASLLSSSASPFPRFPKRRKKIDCTIALRLEQKSGWIKMAKTEKDVEINKIE